MAHPFQQLAVFVGVSETDGRNFALLFTRRPHYSQSTLTIITTVIAFPSHVQDEAHKA
jgi:hypothetical protein